MTETTNATAGLTWRRHAPGWHWAVAADQSTYEASKDHRPGVDFWHLTRHSPRIGTRKLGSYTTLRSAKVMAEQHAAGVR